MSEDEDQLGIDLPAFDERSTRGAVRRAVVRTAITAVAGVLVLLTVAGLASGLWSARSSSRLRFIMGRAYQVANPGYLVSFNAGSRSRLNFGTDLIGSAQALEPSGFSNTSTTVTINKRFYGRISDYTILTPTSIDELFCCIGRSDKDRAAKLLDEWPRAVEISALVELKTPLGEAMFTAFRHRLGICGRNYTDTVLSNFEDANDRRTQEINGCGSAREDAQTAVLAAMVLSPTPQDRRASSSAQSVDGAHRLTWPDYSLVEFDRWASALRRSDEANVRQLLLPGIDEIKLRAREGKIYGFIVTGLRPDRLRDLLKAPELGDITIADVSLAIG